MKRGTRPEMPSGVMTITEAAHALGCSNAMCNAMCNKGSIRRAYRYKGSQRAYGVSMADVELLVGQFRDAILAVRKEVMS